MEDEARTHKGSCKGKGRTEMCRPKASGEPRSVIIEIELKEGREKNDGTVVPRVGVGSLLVLSIRIGSIRGRT